MLSTSTHPAIHLPVQIQVGRGVLEGDLTIPDLAVGVVLFAHGSGSSRHSPRNKYVALQLQQRGLGTLLLDLLTEREEQLDARTAEWRFDIGLLAARLSTATDWLQSRAEAARLPIGYFGASTGAAAALVAASQRPEIAAVVSRGGRPDLAGEALGRVAAATLLIVGSRDEAVLALNRDALARLTRARAKTLTLVPGATHLFEEPGALDQAARLAGDWLANYLKP
jgi:dienelactone hydrolase